MLHLRANGSRTKVNVLKKVKVYGQWKLCPAIVEPGGKLKDRVQVNGRAEVHSEGVYYIEWRENGQRIRQSVPNRHHVLERARLKALELDARKAGIQKDEKPTPSSRPATAMVASSDSGAPSIEISKISNAAGVLLRGVESYLQEIINASVRSQLNSQRQIWSTVSAFALFKNGLDTVIWNQPWSTSSLSGTRIFKNYLIPARWLTLLPNP